MVDTVGEVSCKGIGLGLHISQLITKQFGGGVRCTSEPMKGATFAFDVNLE